MEINYDSGFTIQCRLIKPTVCHINPPVGGEISNVPETDFDLAKVEVEMTNNTDAVSVIVQ